MSEQSEKRFESLFQQDREEDTGSQVGHFLPEEETESAAQEATPPGEPQKKMSRLEKLEQKKAQLEHQIKAIHARENEKVRRARTRRLIQIGALSLTYLNCPDDISPSDFESFIQQFVEQPEVKRYIQH